MLNPQLYLLYPFQNHGLALWYHVFCNHNTEVISLYGSHILIWHIADYTAHCIN